jgi:lambda repressor-like predicted transcriptional regulator
MRTYNGSDIKYLLDKKGYSLSAVAREIGVTPQCVHLVIWGIGTSRPVVEFIERLLGWKPGALKIARATNRRKAA